MINVHFLYRLEVDPTSRLRFRVVGVVDKRALRPVEDEPAFVPRLELAAHLVQVAATRVRRQRHLAAVVDVVTGGLDVLSQVKVGDAPNGQEAGQGAGLRTRRQTSIHVCYLIWQVDII